MSTKMAIRRWACALTRKWKQKDHIKLHRDVETLGLKAKVKGVLVLEIARELVKIAEQGLSSQPQFNAKEQSEKIYLEPLKEAILRVGETEAERLLKLWRTSLHRDPKNLIRYLSI